MDRRFQIPVRRNGRGLSEIAITAAFGDGDETIAIEFHCIQASVFVHVSESKHHQATRGAKKAAL